MVTVAEAVRLPLESAALREMFAARKRVFVDLLKWDVPVVDGRFEIDQFDDENAVYLIVSRPNGGHAGSVRILETTRPHILDSLFPELCAAPAPRGPRVREITRFCLDRSLTGPERLETRDILVSALVRHALDNGIDTYTGVAEIAWLQQILAFGWDCRPLGLPRSHGGKMLGALRIDVTGATPALLAANRILRPANSRPFPTLKAA